MKLIFMGTPEFAVPSLRRLLADGHQVLAVFTQPDKPVGRHQIITPPPVKVCALEHDLTVYQPSKIKTTEARTQFEPLFQQADAGIVGAYGRILPDWMLHAPRLGCINVHSSLLPKYRGAAPINWAIANGETETGVTIMQMDVGMDTGDILLQRATGIGEDETAEQLTPRLAELGATLLSETLDKLTSGEIIPQKQNEAEATYAPLLRREDGQVDWDLTAQQITNRLHGFTPFPGCFTLLNGQRLELISAQAEPGANDAQPPGSVGEVARDSFTIACGSNTRLRVLKVQPAGKRAMSVRDFLNGAKLQPGTVLG